MPSKTKSIPEVELHTPKELLQGAEFLADSDNPTMLRAAVLEAFSALETYAQNLVFSALDAKAISPLDEWLKAELDDRLDKRLSLLESVAIGHPIDAQLKNRDYPEAKRIRNAVTHAGKKVSAPEARFVIQTVYKLLAYLGSTLELELALIELKHYIERNNISITSDDEAVSIVSDYFGQAKAAWTYMKDNRIKVERIDKFRTKLENIFFLEFPQYKILIEVRLIGGADAPRLFENQEKYHRDESVTVRQSILRDIIDQVFRAFEFFELGQTHGILVIFINGQVGIPREFETVHKSYDGRIISIVVKA